jgi:hypothetical protein
LRYNEVNQKFILLILILGSGCWLYTQQISIVSGQIFIFGLAYFFLAFFLKQHREREIKSLK